jgi:cytochrome c peroxidase
MRLSILLAATVLIRAQSRLPVTPLGLDALMPVPADNPMTGEKVELGRKLFSDSRLSRTGQISCASCHDGKRAFTDGRRVSEGVFGRRGTRNAPALVNRGYGTAQFWDGRAASLEEQVLKPIQDPNEMDMTLEEVTSRLGIGQRDLAAALASYVRSIRSGDSPLDQYLARGVGLSPEEQLGLRVFRVKGNCVACHVGPNFTDERFHNTGIAWKDAAYADAGRSSVTGRAEDRGAFKTPTLREAGRTGPYMHDGSIATLEEVIEHYDRGGVPNPQLDPEIRPLHLSPAEKRGLAAFLQALSGEITQGMAPPAGRPLRRRVPAHQLQVGDGRAARSVPVEAYLWFPRIRTGSESATSADY